jgi:glucose-1-phosphatase
MEIRNIIFDLGGVLLNISYQASIDEFKALGITNFDQIFSQASQDKVFDGLDKGHISPDDFRTKLRDFTGLPLSDAQINKAWNAMLREMPGNSLTLLEQVRDHYRIFLLSNTNAIHFPDFLVCLKETHGYESMEVFFEKQYLSYEIGMRKPDVEIFEYVVNQNRLNPSETLFIDDTFQHVEGARKAGLKAYWLDISKESVLNLFEKGRLKESFLKQLQNHNS